MNETLAGLLIRYRLWFFLASIMLLLGAVAGMKHLKQTADYKVFFASDDPYLVSFENLQDTYTRADTVFLILAPKSQEVFSKETLTAVLWLTEQAWKLPYSIRVDSLTNYQHTSVQEDELIVDDLVPTDADFSPAFLGKIKTIALGESLLVKRLISTQGHVTAINITLQMPEDQTVALHELMDKVHALTAKFKQEHPDIDVYMTGVSPVNYSFETVTQQDFGKLLPLMILAILGIIGYMTRSVSNTIITLLIVIASVVTTIGCLAWWGMTLNNINSVAPLVIMTLAVADCVHLLTSYSQNLRTGLSNVEAMQKSVASNIRPVFLTFFTTSVGFMGMNTIDSPPFQEFGHASSLGITLAFIFSFTMLPQLGIWFARTQPQKNTVDNPGFYLAIANFVIKRPRQVFFSTIVLSVSISSMLFLNDLNDDNIKYFSENVPLRQSADFSEKNLSGTNIIEYSLDSKEEYGVTDLVYLQKVDGFVEWLRAQPEVSHVGAFTETLKRLNQNMHNDDPGAFKLPESRELASQYLLMYEMSLPMGMDLNNQVDIKKSSLRVTVQAKRMKAREILALEERAQGWLAANAPELKTPGASPTIMFSHIGQRNIESIMVGTLASVFIICTTLFLGLGSLRLGVLSLLPNVFPAAIMLGLWGIFIGEVNMGVAVVFTVTTGIVVDDTIYLFSKYSEAIKKQMNVDDAIRYTFEKAGKSVVTTTMVLCAGFSMLVFSDFMVNVTLGIMVAGTIAIALVFDLLFLPSVLKVFPEKQAKTAPSQSH